jgi:hypothetical protein
VDWQGTGLPFNRYAWLTTHNSFARLGQIRSPTGTPNVSPRNQQDTVTQQLNVSPLLSFPSTSWDFILPLHLFFFSEICLSPSLEKGPASRSVLQYILDAFARSRVHLQWVRFCSFKVVLFYLGGLVFYSSGTWCLFVGPSLRGKYLKRQS